MRQIMVLARIHTIQPGAHYSNGCQAALRGRAGCSGLQSAFVRSAIHPQGQAGDDRPAHFCKRFAKGTRIARALWRGIAAAHHGNARLRLLQTIHLPHGIQQNGRIGHLQQHLRIGRVCQREQAPLHRRTCYTDCACCAFCMCCLLLARSTIPLLQPLPCGFNQFQGVVIGRAQSGNLFGRKQLLQCRMALRQYLLRQAKSRQQAAGCTAANAFGLQQL